MPSFTTAKLPKPKSWDEFEDINADVFKKIWNTKYVTRNGRLGQSQNGIDIYNQLDSKTDKQKGIQCKNQEIVTINEIKEWISKAEDFKPQLNELVISISAKKDVKIEEEVRKISKERLESDKFSIKIIFWEDLSLEISNHEDLMEKHFPQFIQKNTKLGSIHNLIMDSDLNDWEFNAESEIYIYKKDVQLTIRKYNKEKETFNEDWTKSYADHTSYTAPHDLFYGSTHIERVYLASVDGGRMYIPYPKYPNKLVISDYQYKIGKIINNFSGYRMRYDFYLQKANIQIKTLPIQT